MPTTRIKEQYLKAWIFVADAMGFLLSPYAP